MVFASILLSNGAWIAKHVHVQDDSTGIICYLGRRISLEYADGEFPHWKEIGA